jgi:PKD repeat protein
VKRALDAGARCVLVLGITGMVCLGAVPSAQAGTSSVKNPTVVFDTPGTKQVTLTACSGPLNVCSTVTKSVVVLDPAPVVLSASAALLSAEVGQLVPLVGTGRGKPPLNYTWRVTPPAAPAFTLAGATAWWDTTGMAPGVYQVAMTITNSAGTAVSPTSNVILLAEQPSGFYTLASPCRVYDSRSGAGTPLASGTAALINMAPCGIPADAHAVAGNLTIVGPTGTGNVVLYPGNYPVPVTNTINFKPGAVRANGVVMPLASDGSATLSVYPTVANNGSVHVILDVSGYFKPVS